MRCSWTLVGLWLLAHFDDVKGFQSTLSPPTSRRPTRKILSSPKKTSASTSVTQLQVSPWTMIARSPIGAMSLLAGIVLIHEAGHYLAARCFNISVVEFSIGFGPKIAGFKAFGNDFNVRALPLGGYVRFPENYDVKKLEQKYEAANEVYQKRKKLENWTLWQCIFDFLTFGYWDHRRRQRRKREITAAVAILSKTNNNNAATQRMLKRLEEQQRELEVFDYEIEEYSSDPNLLENRPWYQRALVFSGGVLFNLVLAFVLYFGDCTYVSGMPEPVYGGGVVVVEMPRTDGPLRQGDIIVGINERPLVLVSPATTISAEQHIKDVVTFLRYTPEGESVRLKVQRDESEIEVTVEPLKDAGDASIGANLKGYEMIKGGDFIEALEVAYRNLSCDVADSWRGLRMLLGSLVKVRSPSQEEASILGPIGVAKCVSEIVSTEKLGAVLRATAVLSVNMAFINALPYPALDGGQVAFLIAEAMTRKKIDERVKRNIDLVSAVLLLVSLIAIAISDVKSILRAR